MNPLLIKDLREKDEGDLVSEETKSNSSDHSSETLTVTNNLSLPSPKDCSKNPFTKNRICESCHNPLTLEEINFCEHSIKCDNKFYCREHNPVTCVGCNQFLVGKYTTYESESFHNDCFICCHCMLPIESTFALHEGLFPIHKTCEEKMELSKSLIFNPPEQLKEGELPQFKEISQNNSSVVPGETFKRSWKLQRQVNKINICSISSNGPIKFVSSNSSFKVVNGENILDFNFLAPEKAGECQSKITILDDNGKPICQEFCVSVTVLEDKH